MNDDDLRVLLVQDPQRGWRAFIDEHTPTLLALIRRGGITDRDEVMDVYVRACERLAADDCARLRRHDPSKGPLRSWLAVVVRNAAVDWVRSRTGRRRLFGAIKDLALFDRRVFELFYWEGLMPTDIAALVADAEPDLSAVFESLSRIESTLTSRHRTELMSLAARRQQSATSDIGAVEDDLMAPSTQVNPENRALVVEIQQKLDAALRQLPGEDAAIVRFRFCEGLGVRDVQQALRLRELPEARIADILARLRALMAGTASAAPRKAVP